MELLKDSQALNLIKEDKVDKIFFEKIDGIKALERSLTQLGREYLDLSASLDGLDEEGLDKVHKVIDSEFETVSDLKRYFQSIGEKLDYSALDDSFLYDDEKQEYRFESLYRDKTREGSPIEVYNMAYSLSGEDSKIETEANLYISTACKCCAKKEINVRFPDGEDVNHYILVCELEEIREKLNKCLEKYRSIYDSYIGLI